MKYLSVKNYEKFQHYKDRNPPWIKLYNELLDDYQFGCLQDASKMHLIGIWLLASRLDNCIPYDEKWIAGKINATSKVNLQELITNGFIIVIEVASEMLAEGKQNACLETEGETETETEIEIERKRGREKLKLEDLKVSHVEDWLAKKRAAGRYAEHDPEFVLEKLVDYCKSKNKRYDDYVAAYRNAFDWAKCQPKHMNNWQAQQKTKKTEQENLWKTAAAK